jgi:colanic acid/amylovoran biosynthesis glycosyltransferase
LIHYITSIGLGQPWVGNELRIVQREGIPFVLHAMREPSQVHFKSDWARKIVGETRVLYPLPAVGMALSILLAPLFFGGRFFAALGNALFGKREHFRARVSAIWHFFVACHWARGLRRDEVSLIHSQWIHSNGTIAMYGAWLLGKPFSFTGHAADLFRNRVALEDKVRRAAFIICISEFHRSLFKDLGARDEQLTINYCGIDTSLFSPKPIDAERKGPVHVLSAGRLVEKKGFEYLIDACKRLLDEGLDLRCTIAGSGPDGEAYKQRIRERGIEDSVQVTGLPLAQEDIPEFMHGGDIFVLACVWASDNDVDGLPQLTMEAMACGLPAITTRLVGNPDLVVDGQSGLLVEPRDSDQLAEAIRKLAKDGELARKLARQGREFVVEKFDIDRCMQPLIDRFRAHLSASAPPR